MLRREITAWRAKHYAGQSVENHDHTIVFGKNIAIVQDVQWFVDKVLLHHNEVKWADTSAAVSAWYAGDYALALIEEHGLSQREVGRRTGVPETSLRRYLAVRRARRSPSNILYGESINDIIGELPDSKREKKARAATFSEAEAEYAMKLKRMADSTSPHEADIAAHKLDQFASDHGMTISAYSTIRTFR